MAEIALRASPSLCSVATPLRNYRKWADIVDNDDDDSTEEEWSAEPLPLPADDSYREEPVNGLEDSRNGLNLGLAKLTATRSTTCESQSTSEAHKDFNFLFHRLRDSTQNADCATECPDVATEDGSSPFSLSDDGSFRLNADAPEFIPTLSHSCPIVGFCDAIPENTIASHMDDLTEVSTASGGLRSPRTRVVSSPSSTDSIYPEPPASPANSFIFHSSSFQEFELDTPAKGRLQSDGFGGMSPRSSRKSITGKKRRAGSGAIAASCVKRTKSEERREVLKKGLHEMPELSEEDWERRCATRMRAIEVGKATPEYARYCEVRSLGDAEESGMMTPDPMDRSISKRHWKHIVQEWRNALKRLHGMAADGETGSTVSVDEGLSIVTSITDEADATSTSYGDDDQVHN